MRFSCSQSQLSKAINTVSRAVSTRTTIPVLKSILLEATEDHKLKLSASDLDFSIETVIDVQVEEEGAIAVGAKLFADIVRKLPNEVISVETNGGGIVLIKALNSEFNLVGQSADEFPAIKTLEEEQDTLVFDKNIFTDMIRKTSFCASVDDNKGIIVGILLEIGTEGFNMVALDGFRMAVSRENMTSAAAKNIVISARILNDINKIITESSEEDDIKLILGNKRAAIYLENTKIFLRLMDGEFIKYRDILPKESSTTVKISRKGLMDSVERASLFAREGRNNLIICSVNNNFMQITSTSEEGNVKEDLLVETEGPGLEIGFNSKYILDALKVIEDEEVIMEFNTPVTPCLIKPTIGERFEYLILPVRIPSR